MITSVLGRDAEWARVAKLLAEDQPVVVVGEAGIGKTALLRAVAAGSGREAAEGGALSTLSWMQYLPLERALNASLTGDATAVAASIEARVGDGVLLLDDLHWADSSTLDVVALLSGRIGLLAGVRRGGAASPNVLDRLHDAGFSEVALAPLAREYADAIVRSLRPDLGDAAVGRVVERTGGNPLLLQELTASGEPSASLRLAIAARLRTLDAAGRDTFALLALAGRPMSLSALEDAGVKSLLDAELVSEVAGGIAVRHALLAEILVDQLDDDDRRDLHLRLARSVADDGEKARHYQLAGDRERAFDAALRAADRTDRAVEQATHLAIAAQCASGPADALRLRAAEALERVHDWNAMVQVLDLIDPGNREAQATACLLRGRSAWTAGDRAGLRQMLDTGLDLVRGSGSTTEVRLLIEHARLPIFVDVDLDAAVSATERALQLAHETGVDIARAEYLRGTALVVAQQPGGAEHLRAAISAARAADDVNTEFLAGNNLVAYYESTDEPSAGRAVCDEFIARANELGLGEWALSFRTVRATLDFHTGDYAAVVSEAEDLIERLHERRGRDAIVETLCMTLIDLGRIEEALRWLERLPLSDDYRGMIQTGWVQAEAALWSGRPARAVEVADGCLTGTDDTDPNLELIKVTRAWALWSLDRDPGTVPDLHAYPMLHAVRFEVQGVVDLAAGRDARPSFEQAAASWATFHLRGHLRCRWALGEACRRAGETDRAIRVLTEVEQVVARNGMLPLLARVHQSLRAAGVRRSAPRSHRPEDLLSLRQRELLRLVGEGFTNAEIAQRLGVSRYTVISQLSSAVTKLGATGRTHAAALVSR